MGLKGYTFDRMKISPKADALLYHTMLDSNDRIVKGYKDELKVVATGLNTYVSPGACVVQGRMIEIDEEMQLSVPANTTGHVCIVIDLTQVNTSQGEAGTPEYMPVNNQIRLEVVKDLVQQNLHNGGQLYTFPLASFISTGSTVNLTKIDHNQRIVDSGSNDNGNWTRFADGTMICTIIKKKNITIQSPAGGIFNSGSQTVLFPWPFASQPCVSHSVNSGYGSVWTSLGDNGVGVLGCSVKFWSGFAVPSTELTFSITAIGRWK